MAYSTLKIQSVAKGKVLLIVFLLPLLIDICYVYFHTFTCPLLIRFYPEHELFELMCYIFTLYITRAQCDSRTFCSLGSQISGRDESLLIYNPLKRHHTRQRVYSFKDY